MATKTFTVMIEDLPRKRLLGNWMSLNVAGDRSEYVQLKEAFSRRLKALPEARARPGYGVCAEMRENLDCRYWTAIEASPDGVIPNGMIPINLAAGPYACLSAAQGVTLAEFYDYVCNSWERNQTHYRVDHGKPCFEFFGENWAGAGGVKLFVPLKEHYQQMGLEQPLETAISA